jgi:hypothetical protein
MNDKQSFDDSIEATYFMFKLNEMLADPRLKNWIQATDLNYGTSLTGELNEVIESFDRIVEEITAVE